MKTTEARRKPAVRKRYAEKDWREDVKRLLALCEDATPKITLTELAPACGLSLGTFSNGMYERRDFGVDFFAKAAKRLGVSAAWLAWQEGPRERFTASDWATVYAVAKVPRKKRAELLSAAIDSAPEIEQHEDESYPLQTLRSDLLNIQASLLEASSHIQVNSPAYQAVLSARKRLDHLCEALPSTKHEDEK